MFRARRDGTSARVRVRLVEDIYQTAFMLDPLLAGVIETVQMVALQRHAIVYGSEVGVSDTRVYVQTLVIS